MEKLSNFSSQQFSVDQGIKEKCYWAMGLGILALAASCAISPKRMWLNILIDNYYFLTLALSGVFFMALQFVTNSSWMRPSLRISQAMTNYLPFGLIIMLVLGFGIHEIYEWSHSELVKNDPILIQKVAYLNIPFFLIRMILFIGLWIIFAKLLSRGYDALKEQGTTEQTGVASLSKYSAIFMVVFGLTFSFASYDWIMSLEPHWFSTIFSLYTFSGFFVGGIAFITLALLMLQQRGYLKNIITEDHYHDLGKWLFGMSTFWAYIWFSQYMLIWYSNIPEETSYYVLRSHHTWDWLFWINLIVNWTIPFFALLSRHSKRNKFVLSRVAVLLLIGRWLDLYLLTAPKVFEEGKLEPYVSVLEIFIALGFAGLFVLIFMKSLQKRSLVKTEDPYYKEGLHLHQ